MPLISHFPFVGPHPAIPGYLFALRDDGKVFSLPISGSGGTWADTGILLMPSWLALVSAGTGPGFGADAESSSPPPPPPPPG